MLQQSRARYVITGEELPSRNQFSEAPWQRWFDAMPLWAHRDSAQYSQRLYERDADGGLIPIVVYTPDYYRTMMSRLYVFGGAAVTPENSTWVMTWVTRTARNGPYNEVVAFRRYGRYEDAARAIGGLGPGRHQIVGRDPSRSCVPVAALTGVKVAYESPERSEAFQGLPAVRIFEVSSP